MSKKTSPEAASLSSRRQNSFLIWSGAALLLEIVGTLVWSIAIYPGVLNSVDHTHEVIKSAQHLRQLLTDSETTQREFLIASDDKYLRRYRVLVPEVLNAVRSLRELTGDNPVQQSRLSGIERAVREKLAELDDAISARKEQNLDAARAILETGRDELAMERCRALLAEFEAQQYQFLNQRIQKRQQEELYVGLGAAAGLLFALVFLALAKRNQKALAKSEARTRILFESAPFGGMIVNPVDLSIVDFNNHLCVQLGYSPAEFESMRVPDIVALPPDQVRANTSAIVNATEQDRIHQFESAYRTKTGEIRDVLVTAASVQLENRPYFYAAIQDITERNQHAKAVRETEAQFSTLANAIPHLCWIANADGWIFWYNDRWYEYTGTTPEQMKGWGWKSVHDPETLPCVLERWTRSITTGEPFDMVLPLRGADGTFRPFLTRVMPVRDSDGKVVRWFGTNTDISEQREAEKALQRHAELLRNSFDAIVLWKVDGGIESWNRGAERLYGFSPEEAVGRVSHELLRTVFPVPWTEIRSGLYETGGWEGDLRHRTRDGGEVIVSARLQLIRETGGVERVLEISRDITGRRKAEEALRESESRYSALAEALPAIVYVTSPDGQTEYVNRRWQEYTGLTFAGTIDRAAIIHPDDYERSRAAWSESIQSGIPYDVELRLKRHDGVYRWFRSQASPLRDQRGRLVKWLGIATDIEKDRQAEERLRESQKLEALGRLAGGVAHDFNNLLTAISGYNTMAIEELDDRPALLAHLREVKGAADRAADLTRQLLAFSRRQIAQPRPLNLNNIVASIRNLLARVIGEDIELIARLAPDAGFISADPIQVDQVIMNLAVNARDAMPNGGQLTLTTARASFGEEEARASNVPAGEYALLSVSDTGTGMDAETKNRLFEPFFTTKEQGKGTGLGLAIVYGVVSQSGGSIRVESEPGRGTTFHVYFPCCAETEKPAPSVTAGAPAKTGETVLLVEDEPTVRNLVARMLRQRGFSVLEAATPAEAIRQAAGHPAPIDVLLSDVLMPEMRGPEVARRVRELRANIAVVFMSGYSDRTFVDPGALQHAAYLQKPFTADELKNKIRETLDGARKEKPQ